MIRRLTVALDYQKSSAAHLRLCSAETDIVSQTTQGRWKCYLQSESSGELYWNRSWHLGADDFHNHFGKLQAISLKLINIDTAMPTILPREVFL